MANGAGGRLCCRRSVSVNHSSSPPAMAGERCSDRPSLQLRGRNRTFPDVHWSEPNRNRATGASRRAFARRPFDRCPSAGGNLRISRHCHSDDSQFSRCNIRRDCCGHVCRLSIRCGACTTSLGEHAAFALAHFSQTGLFRRSHMGLLPGCPDDFHHGLC